MAKKTRKTDEKRLQQSKPARSLNPFEEMERLFEGWHPGGWLHPFHRERPSWAELSVFGAKAPSVDLIERDDAIVIKAELPGVDKKDMDISVTKNSVSIKGTTSHEEKEEKGDYYRSEISRGEYARTLTLPAEIDEDRVKATFKNGILELNLPKLEQSARKTVEIK
ncbi:MAG TPA: Hsp20/alpha crystallin family protein [Gammaproteobacteria bacterium]|jgi:HSP20 family protein|nr:Hsp20/alpha crystallin family protein [Gammaproteobacteria bacterium]